MGEIVVLAIIVGIMHGLKVDASTANNTYGLSVLGKQLYWFYAFICRNAVVREIAKTLLTLHLQWPLHPASGYLSASPGSFLRSGVQVEILA